MEIIVGIAVDLPTRAPWQYALDLSNHFETQLRALLVNDQLNRSALALAHGDVLQEIGKRLNKVWEEKADEVERELRQLAGRRAADAVVLRVSGHFVDAMIESARYASLIVVGRGRNSNDDRGSLGDRVEALARRSSKAIFITPATYRRPSRVVAAYAGKDQGDRVLELASQLAEALQVGLTVLTVGDDPARTTAIQDQARRRLGEKDLAVEYQTLPGKPEKVIPRTVTADDVLVLGPHGRSPLYRMLLGKVTSRVIRAVKIPFVLAAKD